MLKLSEFRKEIIGKKLQLVIDLDVNESNSNIVNLITEQTYSEINSLEMLVFEGGFCLIFADYDCDGYRSGDWYLIKLKQLLDKGNTKDIKRIDSIVRDIQYIENEESEGKHFVLITTDNYIITMGQNYVHDYYPSNFFSIEEAKEFAVSEAKKKIMGGVINLEE